MVERECRYGDKKTKEKRFFINSIATDAKKFSQAVRGHWGC
jgi:predicted transposase YbfD/YdcC